ncbi:MAG: matrixin family metalloprotease [Deltaproteobacteria bacterium]|nr:matrixin family metalloprotease [Deltaproteobacteria bacterium]
MNLHAAALRLVRLPALLLPTGDLLAFSISTSGGKEVKWGVEEVPYVLDQSGWSGINDGSDLAAVVASFNDWQGVTCSYLKFKQTGTTLITTVMSTGAEANGQNELIWKEGYWPYGASVLGVTSPLYNFSGVLQEADIAFNGTISWNTKGNTWYSMDVKSVAIHEIGHLFGLGHNLQFSESDPPTMAPYVDPYGKSASLHQDDKSGICFLYPATPYTCASDSACPYVISENAQGDEFYASKYKCQGGKCVAQASTGKGELGATCNSDSDCKSPYFCVKTQQGFWCSSWCSVSAQDCPDGFGCYPTEGQSDGICFKVDGTKTFGEDCYFAGECISPYFCLTGLFYCSKYCTDVDGGTGCPVGYTCVKYSGGQGACIKGTVSKKDNGLPCEAGTDCKSGLCFPDFASQKKYCRDKCNPMDGLCPSGGKCIPVPGDPSGTHGGCVPLARLPEKKDGMACQANWECQSGYCYFDSEVGASTCRKTCNPAAPQCPAGTTCMSVGGASGACLPAPVPQPEGAWCMHHPECLSGYCAPLPGVDKKFCRAACSSQASCPNGTECVFYDGQPAGLCMPLGKGTGQTCFSSMECTSQICWSPSGAAVCLVPCLQGVCPEGFLCGTGSPYGSVCISQDGAYPVGASCTANEQCASKVCVASVCREACNVLSPTCPEGLGCMPLNADDEGGCVVPGASKEGAACSSDFECATLLCVDDGDKRRCRMPCDPAKPICGSNRQCTGVEELSGLSVCLPKPTDGTPSTPGDGNAAPVASKGGCGAGPDSAGAPLPWGSVLLLAAMLFLAGTVRARTVGKKVE